MNCRSGRRRRFGFMFGAGSSGLVSRFRHGCILSGGHLDNLRFQDAEHFHELADHLANWRSLLTFADDGQPTDDMVAKKQRNFRAP